MTIDALLLCGFSYRQNNYKKLIETAPKNWKFHKINYFEILKLSTNNNYHEAIYKYIINNNIEKVNLVAHSLGGAYALNFAFHHPDKINQLYLLNTIGIRHKNIFLKFLIFALLNKMQNLDKHLTDDLSGIYNILKNPIMHLKLLRYVKSPDLESKAASIKVKTKLIWGKNDYLFPLEDAHKLNKLISNSRLIVLKDLGHDWPLYSPELFWKNI